MAQIQYSALVAGMSGKLNGNVLTRNKGGAVIRNKVTPINPNSSFQARQRAIQSDLAKAWATLSDGQRQGWQEYGKVLGTIGAFGNNRILAGMPTYVGINRLIVNAGGTRIDDAPVSQQVPSILNMSLVANSAGPSLMLTFDPTPLVAPAGLYLFATPAISQGIGNVASFLRFVSFTSAATSPLNILADWNARLGAFPISGGQRIAVSAQVLDLTTGAISASNNTSTIIL